VFRGKQLSDNSTEFNSTISGLLVIVPCGQSKIWKTNPKHGPSKAREAYTGVPFKVNKDFAEKFADRWLILSAKYGFIDPDFMIPEDYNVTFKKPSTKPISLDTLEKQVKIKNLRSYKIAIALGGEDYSSKVKQLFAKKSTVIAPATGLPLGIGMHRIKSLLKLTKEQMLKRIANPDE